MLDLSSDKYSKAVSGVLLALGKFKAATKQLKIQRVKAGSQERKLVISTNWLDAIKLHEGRLIKEAIIGAGQGFVITPATLGDTGAKKVYGRSYKNRKNERESQLQIKSQKSLDVALGDAERVHITFSLERVEIKPITHAEGALTSEGVSYELNQDAYSGVVEAIEIIKQKRFAEVVYAVKDGVDEDLATLFSIQLRRLGYTITEHNGEYRASLGQAMSFSALKPNMSPHKTRFNFKAPASVFAACTSGVDVRAMECEQFQTKAILEWRPQEARDNADKTEIGAINAACLSQHAELVINEDIYAFDLNNLSETLMGSLNTNVFHISVQCDDFSSLKTHALRQKAIEELSTTQDMIFLAIALVRKLKTPVVVLENVANFASSTANKVFTAAMRSFGYRVYTDILNAKDYNGLTNRARCFIVCSKLPVSFEFPAKQARTVDASYLIDMALSNGMLRDVSHTVSVRKGIETGRIRTLTRGKDVAPTLTKSQSRQTKDSCYFEVDGQYYLPSNDLMKIMMGMNNGFDFVAGTSEEISEMIGQSIDVPTHSQLMIKVREHILSFVKAFKAHAGALTRPATLPQMVEPVHCNRFAVMF